MLKILSSEYQPYAYDKILHMPRSLRLPGVYAYLILNENPHYSRYSLYPVSTVSVRTSTSLPLEGLQQIVTR